MCGGWDCLNGSFFAQLYLKTYLVSVDEKGAYVLRGNFHFIYSAHQAKSKDIQKFANLLSGAESKWNLTVVTM